jgi:hypothetical protein
LSNENPNQEQMKDFLAQSKPAGNPLQQYMRTPQIYITLPSKGKYWDPGSIEIPINGEVPILSMSSLDELTLKSPDALMNGQAVVDVIHSCVPCIKDAWGMPITDLDTILIAIRIATYGENMEYSSSCPECKEFNEYEIDLKRFLEAKVDLSLYDSPVVWENLIFKLRPQTYRITNNNNLEVFEQQRIVTVVNDQSLDAEIKVQKFNEIFKKMTELTMRNITQSIEYIETNGEKVTNRIYINDFIANSDVKAFKDIKDRHSQLDNSVPDKTVHTTCPDCQHKYVIPFTFDHANFFALAS